MTAIKPMLAHSKNPDLSALTYPQIVQPKFDGIRALIVDGVVQSRSGKPIRNAEIQAALGRPEFNGLDGELLVGDPTANDAMQRTSEFVMSSSKTGAAWAFYVFDKWDSDESYSERFALLAATLPGLNLVLHRATGRANAMVLVTGDEAASVAEVEAAEAQFVSWGYEGAILRDPRAPYKHGRAGKLGPLLKIKRWTDAEATIIGVNEQMHNANEAKRDAFGRTERSTAKAGLIPTGTLGNLRCRTPEGIEFEIGTGFDSATRDMLWGVHSEGRLVGRLAKYKFIPVGVKVAPRFPVYLGLRDPDDTGGE